MHLQDSQGHWHGYQLQPPGKAFSEGSCHHFWFEDPELAAGVQSLSISHTGVGFSSSWLLDTVLVQHVASGGLQCWVKSKHNQQ